MMNLYHVQYDGQSFWVQAATFTDAVTAWKAHVKVVWAGECDGTEEPESVHLVHDEPVIIGGPKADPRAA